MFKVNLSITNCYFCILSLFLIKIYSILFQFYSNRARKEPRRQHYPLQVWLPEWVAMLANIHAPLKIPPDLEDECIIQHTIIRYAQQKKRTRNHSFIVFNIHMFFLFIYNKSSLLFFFSIEQKRFIIISFFYFSFNFFFLFLLNDLFLFYLFFHFSVFLFLLPTCVTEPVICPLYE